MGRQDTPSRELDRYIVRLPDGMRDELKAVAEKNNRSMNAEIVARLEASFDIGTSLAPEIAALIERHVQQQVQDRLRRIAANLGNGDGAL